jgi:hypothetical protein
MDDIELTKLFVEYAQTVAHAKTVKAMMEEEVLKRAESVKIAGVEAKYFKPSNEAPDYEATVLAKLEGSSEKDNLIDLYTTITKTVRWKDLCEALHIEAPQGEPKPARVLIK